jgi:hypothetical protein
MEAKLAILIIISVVFANATIPLNGWGQIEQAFMAGQPFNIIVDYGECTGQASCTICSRISARLGYYISLNSTNMIAPITSISENSNKDQIAIASFQQITTIPEFESLGYKQNIVTNLIIKQQSCEAFVPCPTIGTIQVYSLNNKYAFSEVYTCVIGEGLNIFLN